MRNQHFTTAAFNNQFALTFNSTLLKEERPSYKINHWGKDYLADLELLCLIMPNSDWDATLQTARRLLAAFDNRLSNLAKASTTELMEIEGVNQYTANRICAAFEIGRRKLLETSKDRPQITSSKDAYNAFFPLINDLAHEEFWILILNRANRITHTLNISKGGIAGTVVDPKVIFKLALEHSASGLILGHNHPSGNPRPSKADIAITKKLKTAGQTLDITILDHLIIAQDNGFYSFADEGVI